MSLGNRVRISQNAVPFYRKQATSLEGVVVGISRSGQVVRVHIDDVADSYVRAADLEIVNR
jgi:hypothetical protein